MLIVAALSYLVLPVDLISAKRLPVIGWIDEAVSLVYAYKKVCRYVTPEIESEVDNILERWIPKGKYELIEEYIVICQWQHIVLYFLFCPCNFRCESW